MRWLVVATFLTGCVPGCGGEARSEGTSGPVRLPPGVGGAEHGGAPVRIEEETPVPTPPDEALAEPPPVEPPP